MDTWLSWLKKNQVMFDSHRLKPVVAICSDEASRDSERNHLPPTTTTLLSLPMIALFGDGITLAPVSPR
ncbi:unnamed protein product, partial [Iphiclides podalirius]